jgi:hypothetical protein
MAGGFTTNSQWPVRGREPFALQRIDWNGRMPFEVRDISIQPDGFVVRFTSPADPAAAARPESYAVTTFTHIYHGGYGSPEVDQQTLKVVSAAPSDDGMAVRLRLDRVIEDHVHDFDFRGITARDGRPLLHSKAYYTVNEIPAADR